MKKYIFGFIIGLIFGIVLQTWYINMLFHHNIDITGQLGQTSRHNMSDIILMDGSVCFKINTPVLIKQFAGTHSMKPMLDKDNLIIDRVPQNETEIIVGDVITFKVNTTEKGGYRFDTLTHRVIEIGYDKVGWYAVTKGDNLLNVDPFKIRFDQVEGLVTAILY